MQVSVEAVGTLGRRLTVALPAEDVEKEFSTRLTRLSKQVKMPGFRPGKVPLKMIEAQYGASLLQEVAGDLIQSSLREAIGREGLRPAGSPRIAPPQVARGKQLEYTAEIDLYPEIKRLDLAGVKIERPVASVTPADVEHTLDTIRKQRAAWNAVARVARSGDRVTIDFTGRLNGAEFDGGSAKGFPLVLGTNTLVEDFENGLVGAQAGDVRKLTVKFPKDYRHTLLAGQTMDFEAKVHDVAEAVLPEVNAEFAKLLGIQDGDVARLRDETKANLEREAAARSRAVARARVLKCCSMPIRSRPPGADRRRDQPSETARSDGAPVGGNRRRLPQPRPYARGAGADSGRDHPRQGFAGGRGARARPHRGHGGRIRVASGIRPVVL